jgi:hypothetical protein
MSRVRATVLTAPALAALALALAGCETTQEKSEKLERQAKHLKLNEKGLSITHVSTVVKVIGIGSVHSSEGAAVAVTVRNGSARTLRAVPIAVTANDASGPSYQNDAPGLEAALTALPSLAPHATVTWVDDQLPAGSAPTSVTARVGEAPAVRGAAPRIAVTGAHLESEPSGAVATGTVSNDSAVEQKPLVVFVVARRGEHVVAAGRAVLPELAAHSSTRFQAFLIGEGSGRLEVAAPPTTFG